MTIYDKGEEPVYAIDRGQHLVAAFYRNSAIHWFVNRAILELALLWTSQQESENPELTGWTEAKRIRDLLKFEFFFPDRDTFEAELREELALSPPASSDPGGGAAGLGGADGAPRAALVPRRPARRRRPARAPRPGRPIEKGALLDECDRVGQQMLLQRRLHGPESVSRELFASALDLKDNLGLLAAGGGRVARGPAAPSYPASRVRHQPDRSRPLIESLDAANRAEVTGVAV